MTKKKLYRYLFVIFALGMGWLVAHVCFHTDSRMGCLFYKITHIPCPSCGTTRSVLAILHGDFAGALYYNPFGFLIIAWMGVIPVWMMLDRIRRSDSFFHAYQCAEILLKQKFIYIPAIALVLGNWAWNFFKY